MFKSIILHSNSRHFLLELFLCMFLLSGCGQTAVGTTTLSSTMVQSMQKSQGQALQPAYNFNRQMTVAGMTVALSGFTCSTSSLRPDNLVLATDRFTYDVGTAKILKNYLQLLNAHILLLSDPDVWTPPNPPKELRWLPGATFCGGTYTIYNNTNDSIQIQQVGFKLTAQPTPNTYQYNHLSFCTDGSSCGQFGSAPPCQFQAYLKLDNGNSGAMFDSPVDSSKPNECPLPLTLAAGSSKEVYITIVDAHQRDRIYTGVPTLTITTIAGQQIVPLTGLSTKLYFTHTDNFPCYQLQGNTFVITHDETLGCPYRPLSK